MALTWTTARTGPGGWNYFGNWQYGSFRVMGSVVQESLYQGKCWVERDSETLQSAASLLSAYRPEILEHEEGRNEESGFSLCWQVQLRCQVQLSCQLQ